MNPNRDKDTDKDAHDKPATSFMMGAIPKKQRSRPPPPGADRRASGDAVSMKIPRHPAATSTSASQRRPPSITLTIPTKMQTSAVPTTKENATGGSSMSMSIPRKPSLPPTHPPPNAAAMMPTQTPAKRKHSVVSVLSEQPFVVRLSLKGLYIDWGRNKSRASGRISERQRPIYQETQETDSDDFLTDSSEDDEDDFGEPAKSKSLKKRKTLKLARSNSARANRSSIGSTHEVGSSDDRQQHGNGDGSAQSDDAGGDQAWMAGSSGSAGQPKSKQMATALVSNATLDSPPLGMLTTLWHSRECFNHIFVMEKPLAWNCRVVTELEWIPENIPGDHADPPTSSPTIDAAEAHRLQYNAIAHPMVWNDPSVRIEISRLNPTKCPIVLLLACAKEFEDTNGRPKFRIKPVADQGDANNLEEVYLVKWRGRSHLHACWERSTDLIKFDQSNNTARQKLRRFAQAQEIALGKDWKKVTREERAVLSTAHPGYDKQLTKNEAGIPPGDPIDESDHASEYFSPTHLEVERIMSCDETDMDVTIFAKQRTANLETEQSEGQPQDLSSSSPAQSKDGEISEAPTEPHPDNGDENSDSNANNDSNSSSSIIDGKSESDKGDLVETHSKDIDKWNSHRNLLSIHKGVAWDPEDNVRYIVKWKGLPYAEVTWEYWRDIKRDGVDEAENFWVRQQPPPAEIIQRAVNKAHPSIRDFRKIKESPRFGISERPRGMMEKDSNGEAKLVHRQDEGEGFRLRSYQLEGVNWLLFNWWNHRSCILADEMGLGKTIQSLCFLKQLQDNPMLGLRGPFLVVAPLSLIGQWKSEATSWAPDLNILLYHGSADARAFLAEHEFHYMPPYVSKERSTKLRRQHVTKFHIMITTYEVVLKDIATISSIRWRALIVDEAHRLKNSKSKLFDELSSVPRDFCLLLTGTPLANATEELWALLHFADREAFRSKEDFLEKFGELRDAEQVGELHSLLKPYLLRRVKEDVEKSLPPKEETILEVTLTPIQKKYYKAIYERNTGFLFKGSKPSNAPSLMNVMMELRKCCNHPYLVRGAEERILADAATALQASQKPEDAASQPVDYVKLFGEQLIKSSGKMVLMSKLLPKLFQNGHKVLIFSQMVRVLNLLEELLKIMKYRYERLDGSTSSSARAAAVDRFTRKTCKRFVMLLSTRAGGLGLNLTAADIVIIFDSDWNPQNDLQAMARAHRIGQTRAVRVYRLLTAKTYEMHMFHCTSMKLGLERAVLSQSREQNDQGDGSKPKAKSEKEAQAKEIDELLKRGAYDVFRDDDDKDAEKFMESNIDQLLAKSSKKIVYGAQQGGGMGSSGLGSFSKASFVADTRDGEKDVDLDDPDFWSKAVGFDAPVETPEDVAQMLDDGVKRSRKQVQQFDPYAEYVEIEQRKQDKIAFLKQQEKEEKEQLRLEKLQKKQDAKNKKKREREELRSAEMAKKAQKLAHKQGQKGILRQAQKSSDTESLQRAMSGEKTSQLGSTPKKKISKDAKQKKPKKSMDRKRMMRRAKNENPATERFRQAWELPQFHRVTAAFLRFGFSRFCKIRHESSLTSVPIQDIEVFLRSYFYHVSLQVGVSLLTKLHASPTQPDQELLLRTIGGSDPVERVWIANAVSTALQLFEEVDGGRKTLRLPAVLTDPSLLQTMRGGAGLRILRRIFILTRIHHIINIVLDDILGSFGYEELGKRGCPISEVSSLDIDLKIRLVTTEELILALALHVPKTVQDPPPVCWWDRGCDIGIVVGTFVHGLGNYDAMMHDTSLPFQSRATTCLTQDACCRQAHLNLSSITTSIKHVFDNALVNAKAKAQQEIHAAVAAAAASSAEREKNAVALREKGGTATSVPSSAPATVASSSTKVPPSPLPAAATTTVAAGTRKQNWSDFVTLRKLREQIVKIGCQGAGADGVGGNTGSAIDLGQRNSTSKGTDSSRQQTAARKKMKPDMPTSQSSTKKRAEGHPKAASAGAAAATTAPSQRIDLMMPDGRLLDLRLADVVSAIEGRLHHDRKQSNREERGLVTHVTSNEKLKASIAVHREIWTATVMSLHGPNVGNAYMEQLDAKHGIGFSGSQCATNHRSLNDGSDFTNGAASAELHQIAYGADAPRFHRGVGVPMNLTRYAIGALAYTDGHTIDIVESWKAVATDSNRSSPSHNATKRGIDTSLVPVAKEQSEDESTDIASGSGSGDGSFKNGTMDVPTIFAQNARLRASICAALLCYGWPYTPGNNAGTHHGDGEGHEGERERGREDSDEGGSRDGIDRQAISTGLLNSLRAHLKRRTGAYDAAGDVGRFSWENFRSAVIARLGPGTGSELIPSGDEMMRYAKTYLLPQCLRLCLVGNSNQTVQTRGSRGEYLTGVGISLYPEYDTHPQCPLPDPCLSLGGHSIEAVRNSYVLLRRVRMSKSIHGIFDAASSLDDVLKLAEQPDVPDSMHGLPAWWDPTLHDAALLLHTTTRGIFALVSDRDGRDQGGAFHHKNIVDHIESSFVGDNNCVPSVIIDSCPSDDINSWVSNHAESFPSPSSIERRLVRICSQAVSSGLIKADDELFANIPMFDHGGWPRD